jgi:hypothetical protein
MDEPIEDTWEGAGEVQETIEEHATWELIDNTVEGGVEEPETVEDGWTWESPQQLISRSSFGTAAVQSFSEQAPMDVVQRVLRQVESDMSLQGQAAEEPPTSSQRSYLGRFRWVARLEVLAKERNRWLFRRRIESQLEKVGQWAVHTFGLQAYLVIATSAAFTVATGVLVLLGQFQWAVLMLMLGYVPEVLDGELARVYKDPLRATRATYVDQVIDRWEEVILFGSIALYYVDRDRRLALLAAATLVLGLITSFERAEATALRFKRGNGSFARLVRLALLVPALFSSWTSWFMAVIVGVTIVSGGWRFLEVVLTKLPKEDDSSLRDTVIIGFPPRLQEFPGAHETASSARSGDQRSGQTARRSDRRRSLFSLSLGRRGRDHE